MLNLLPNVIEALKSDLLNELQNIVTNSTQTLIENGQYQQGDHRLLPDLFTVVVDQFHLVVDSFRIMIQSMNTSVDRNQCADSVKFDMAEVWARVQSVMQMMLTVMIFFVAIGRCSVGTNSVMLLKTTTFRPVDTKLSLHTLTQAP